MLKKAGFYNNILVLVFRLCGVRNKNMKKVVIKIIFLAIVCFAIMPNIDALSKIDTKLSSNIIELKEGNTVELTLAFDNFEEIKKGVNAYKGT